MIKYKYRIIFYLDIDSKDMLDDNQVQYSLKTINKYEYCVINKGSNSLYQELNDYATKRGLIFFASACGFKAVDLLDRLNIPLEKKNLSLLGF